METKEKGIRLTGGKQVFIVRSKAHYKATLYSTNIYLAPTMCQALF